MADNNNNNGNNLVNPNNRNSGIDDSSIRMSISEMGIAIGTNISKSVAQVIKAIEALNKDSKNNNNLDKSIERLIKALEENSGASKGKSNKPKTVTESLIEGLEDFIDSVTREQARFLKKELKANEELQKISNLQNLIRRGDEKQSKAAKQIWDLKQKEIEAYKENIEKQQQLSNAIEFLNIKADTLKAEKEILQKQAEDASTSKEDKNLIDSKLREIDKTLQSLTDEIEDNTDQLEEIKKDNASGITAKEFEKTSKLIDELSSDTGDIVKTASKINKEVEKENRRKAKQEKVESARNYKIADNLADCFDGGLFELGDELSKTFKEATQKHLEGTKTGILGNITAFAEKTFFSIMDYQTEKLTSAISSLQNSFEGTGMELSRAILADRDEIASSWQNVTDELEARGYGEALNVTDLFGLETQAAKAGITDQNLLETIALEAGITSANTGIAAPDFLADEQLIKLQQIYSDTLKEARASGLSEEAATSQAQNVVADAMETIGAQLSAAVQGSGSATAFAQGKSQELFSQYLDQYLMYDADKAKSASAGRVAVYGTVGARSGGTEIANQLNNMLLSLENENVSGELLNLLSGNAIQENLKELMDSGNYGEALKTMLSNIDTLAGDEAGVSQNVILNLLGINPEAYKKLTSNTSMQEILDSIDSIYAETSKGVQATAWTTNQEKVKSGRIGNTKEQQDRNKALTDAVDMWSLAEKSDIRQADKMLISSINAANSGIQSVISWGFESLFSLLQGKFTGTLGTALFGGASAAGAGGGAASAIGGYVAAGLAAFAGGYGLGTLINKAFSITDYFSRLDPEDLPSQAAIDNLSDVEAENQKENDSYHTIVKGLLEENNQISKDTKEAIANDIDELIDATVDTKNSKQAFARTLREGIESGDILDKSSNMNIAKTIKEVTGQDVSELSDDELLNFYEQNKEWFDYSNNKDLGLTISESESNYRSSKGQEEWGYVDKILSTFASDGTISTEESTQAAQDLRTILIDEGKNEEEISAFMDNLRSRAQQTNEYSSAYQAAQRIKDAILTTMETVDTKGQSADIIQEKYTAIIQGYKNGTYPGMTEQEKEFAKRAQIYFDSNSSGGKNSVVNGLAIIDTSKPYYELYSPDNVSKFATGLDYVPYDNYLALLHKGERVQTAAEARLDDLADSIAYNSTTNSNITNTNNNIDGLNTTNNSIKDGFNTTNSNQETIIEALKTIISALSNGNSAFASPDVFESITNNKVALRSNNIARMASMH